jgi:hypothetical protein
MIRPARPLLAFALIALLAAAPPPLRARDEDQDDLDNEEFVENVPDRMPRLREVSPATDSLKQALARPLTVRFAGVPARDVIAYVRAAAKVNLVARETVLAARREPVSFSAEDEPAWRILWAAVDRQDQVWIADANVLVLAGKDGLREFVRQLADCPLLPAERKTLSPRERETLEALDKPVSVRFVRAPLPDVLAFVAQAVGARIVADRLPAEARVTLDLKRVAAGRVLRHVLVPRGLAWTVLENAVVVGTPERLRKFLAFRRRDRGLDKAAPAVREALAKQISFELADVPAADAFAFLQNALGLEISVLGGAARTPLSLKLDEVRAAAALDLLCFRTGLDWEIGADRIIVRPPEKP